MNEVTTGERQLAVSIFSDYTCPWCYIGTARVDRLREELAGEVELEIEWIPFEIHPEVPREGMPVSALGYPREQFEAMNAHLRAQAIEEGLEMGSLERMVNTHDALAASAFVAAKSPDRFDSFHSSVFRAYFGEGRDIADREVLAEIARAEGVDDIALRSALEAGVYDPTIAEATATARRLGVSGTPTFVFGGRYAAVGAQPVSQLRLAVEKALEDRSSEGS